MRLAFQLLAARKYRFVDPKSKKGRNIVLGQVIKFVIAWHILGFVIYKGMKKLAKEKDPDFDKKTSAERQLSMLGKKDLSEVTLYKGTLTEGFKLVHEGNVDEDKTEKL